ncbi:response regulator [Belliella marina]|uniref:Response regulator n=1 Tax=Belliella marina TaxID=1644146 RepID=A0ABW4VQ97_9BACT
METIDNNPGNISILLVEDEIDLQSNLREILEINNFKVAVADDGREALKMLRFEKFDLIISDIMMPNMDGIELLNQVRLTKKWFQIPFIFLTSKAGNSSVREGMDSGADDYLSKPVRIKELIGSINATLEKSLKRNEFYKSQVLQESKWNESIKLHEIGTPISGLLGLVEILEKSWEELSHNEIKEIIKHAKSSLLKLKNTFLKMQIFQELKEIENIPIIQEDLSSCETINATLQKMNLPTTFVLNMEDFIFRFNKEHIRFILEEFIDNALKFSNYNFDDIQVWVGNGSIRVKNKQKIFMEPYLKFTPLPFQQLGREHFEQQGLGLGLYLASQYAEINQSETKFYIDENLQFNAILTCNNYQSN